MGETVDSDDELLALLNDSLDEDTNAAPAPQQPQSSSAADLKTAESEQERQERKARKRERKEQRRQRREAKMAAKATAQGNTQAPNHMQASGTPAAPGHGAAVWVNPSAGGAGATGKATGNKRHSASMSPGGSKPPTML